MASRAGVPQSVFRAVFARDSYTCQICGLIGREERFDRGGFGYPTELANVFLSIDHIIPKSRGGSHSKENLQVLCTVCNTRKGTKVEPGRKGNS